MNMIKKALGALNMKFLGGEVVATSGSVKGEPAMGVTADLQKATGEIRVHLVRTRESSLIVTLELLQLQVPGDGGKLACVRLPVSEAARLGARLQQVAEDAFRQGTAAQRASLAPGSAGSALS